MGRLPLSPEVRKALETVRLLTMREAAAFLGVSPSGVNALGVAWVRSRVVATRLFCF